MDRRDFLAVAPAALAWPAAQAQSQPLPGVPPIGMGTWLTFDVGDDPGGMAQRREVLRRFFAPGGGLVGSWPLYGRGRGWLGELRATAGHAGTLIAAAKG